MNQSELDELFREISGDLGDITVMFVKFQKDGNGQTNPALAGSGTLISVGEVKAILTADHVLDNIAKEKDIGFAFPSRFESQVNDIQLNIFEMQDMRSLTIARGLIESVGPDLGVLVLPEKIVSKFPSGANFYNLLIRKVRMLNSPPSAVDSGIWVLCGAPSEWTTDLPPEQNYPRVKQFKGCAGLGTVTPADAIGDYDFLNFEPNHKGNIYEGPRNFRGFSGGGLWDVLISNTDEGFEVQDKLLSGVAFHQSNIEKDGSQIIRCNGRRSIYKHVIEALKKLSNEQSVKVTK